MKTKFPSCRCGKEFPKRLLSAFHADFESRRPLWEDETLAPQSMMPAFFESIDVAVLFQSRELLSKYADESKTNSALRAAKAIDKFLLVEERLESVNERLTFQPSSISIDPADGSTHSYELERASSLIMNLIGYWLPDQEQLTQSARFGPGASFGSDRRFRDAYFKYRRWPYRYPRNARGPVCDAIYSDHRWFGALMDEYRTGLDRPWQPLSMELFWDQVLAPVVANRITTVPKNSEIDRTIAVEPLLGIYLQLGVDGFIRSRLKRVGIDLNDQSANATAALAASLDDDLATLDLSSASDSVSMALAELLLPRPWFDYLCTLRAPYGILPDGSIIHYQKISSMGNGFTFALESLIFWSLARAVVPDSLRDMVYVYGDDIIVPSSCANPLMDLLTYVGFEVNAKKTFTSGPFRESCGMNAWNGVSINPVRLRKMPNTVVDLATLYDQFFLWYLSNVPEVEFRKTAVAREILSHMPTGTILWGPCVTTHVGHWFFTDDSINVGRLIQVTGYFAGQETKKPNNFMWGKLKATLKQWPSEPYMPTNELGNCFEIQTDACVSISAHHYDVFVSSDIVPWKLRIDI